VSVPQGHAHARARLLRALQREALVIGEVTLTSGAMAQYLVDAKRAILQPDGFIALGELVAAQAMAWDATAVGGMTMGADPIACSALAGGAQVKAFFVRKEAKQHGLARRVEGPLLTDQDRCMLVEDVVTTGGSTIRAIDALRAEGRQIVGVLSICDRLAGGADRQRRRVGVDRVEIVGQDRTELQTRLGDLEVREGQGVGRRTGHRGGITQIRPVR